MVKVLRQTEIDGKKYRLTEGFAPKDGYDLRKATKLTRGQKTIITRTFNELDTLIAQSESIITPSVRSPKKLKDFKTKKRDLHQVASKRINAIFIAEKDVKQNDIKITELDIDADIPWYVIPEIIEYKIPGGIKKIVRVRPFEITKEILDAILDAMDCQYFKFFGTQGEFSSEQGRVLDRESVYFELIKMRGRYENMVMWFRGIIGYRFDDPITDLSYFAKRSRQVEEKKLKAKRRRARLRRQHKNG